MSDPVGEATSLLVDLRAIHRRVDRIATGSRRW